MTLSETRKLGIEFERRVQTMIPEKQYLDKLDTETIYAYLNSYQDKYIHEIYRNLDLIKSGSKLSAHVESVLLQMLKTETIDVDDAKDYTGNITDANGIVIVENGRSVTYPLDPAFYMYVRSVSNVTSTYAFKSSETQDNGQLPIRIIPNELVSQSDVWRILETPHNSLRILRYPAATIGEYQTFTSKNTYYVTVENEVWWDQVPNDAITIHAPADVLTETEYSGKDLSKMFPNLPERENDTQYYAYSTDGHYFTVYETNCTSAVTDAVPTLNVIYDRYTTPKGIKIMYYAQPQRFDLMTSTPCELPMDAFDDLVTGAVDLYVQYVAGAEANKRRMQEAARQLAKENNKKSESNED